MIGQPFLEEEILWTSAIVLSMRLMTRIFLALTLLISFKVNYAHSSDPCNVENVNFHNDEILKLSCQIQDVSAAILEGDEVIPSKIYHFGKQVHLQENVEEGTIPKLVWETFIMGDKTRFGLTKARRGLYGTSGVDTNSFGGDAYNWLMQISIKKECRHPSLVSDLENLSSNEGFKKWLMSKTASMTLQKFTTECKLHEFSGYTTEGCDEIVNSYLNENDIKIVLDHSVKKSFFIRDRSCIEDIKGSPQDWIDILAAQSALWVKRCSSYGDAGIDQLVGLLLQSMAQAKIIIPDQKAKALIDNLKSSNNSFASLVNVSIQANNRCLNKKSPKFSDFLKSKAHNFIDLIYLAPFESELSKLCK